MSIKVMNFSAESAKKPTLFDLLFLIAIYSPKNENKHPSETRNYYDQNFSRFGTYFDDRPKISTYCQISPNIFLLTDCPMKLTVS